MTTETSPSLLETAEAAVLTASESWISCFNRGDAAGCAAGYTENASMQGRPLADLRGRGSIEDFWRSLMAEGPGELTYEDSRVHALSPSVAVLSARWRMSQMGSGIITLERWEKQENGAWLLAEDIFEIDDSRAGD